MKILKVIFIYSNVMALVFFCSGFNAAHANSASSLKTFTFLNIGPKDNIESAAKKLSARGLTIVNARTAFLEIIHIDRKSFNGVLPAKLKKAIAMDKELYDWGAAMEVDEMNIDVLTCLLDDMDGFVDVEYFYSKLTNKLTMIKIVFTEYGLVKKLIIAKHGDGISNNYWEKNSDISVIYKRRNYWCLSIIYKKNLTAHHAKFKAIIKKEKEKNQKKYKLPF